MAIGGDNRQLGVGTKWVAMWVPGGRGWKILQVGAPAGAMLGEVKAKQGPVVSYVFETEHDAVKFVSGTGTNPV